MDQPSWHQRYIQLALRLERIFRQQLEMPFLGYYYGPPTWKQQVEEESIQEPMTLLRAATSLQEQLSAQAFAEHRERYLSTQVRAIELVCRKLLGEQFTLADELEHLYDITLSWIPDEQFETALALYDQALPGQGSVAERLGAWRRRHAIPAEKRDLVPEVIQRCVEEIRRRSHERFRLPTEERVSLETEPMTNGFSGVCLYQGNYHSRCNLDIADYIQAGDPMSTIVEDLCHEMYPGHHTSFVAREQHLYQEQGFLEESIWLLQSPNAIIGEGIATHACSMLFTPEELEAWLCEHIYPLLGIQPDGVELRTMQRATDLLNDIFGNELMLFREGRPEEEIHAYAQKYLRGAPLWLWQKPFMGFVGFYEYYGRRLMRPWLDGDNRRDVFQLFLLEQWCPSELTKRA